MYPCLPGERGLATTLALPGEHIANPVSSNYVNPRIALLVDGVDRKGLARDLPEYRELHVRGLHLEPTTRENLASAGTNFLKHVRAHCDYCDELLNAWARPWTGVEEDDASTKSNSDDSNQVRSVSNLSELYPVSNHETKFHPYSHNSRNPICAPDLYMPVSFQTNSVKPPSASQERYLLFEPQFGGNNQLIAIFQARDIAKVLGRTLVVPPVFLPRVSEFERQDMVDWPDTGTVLKIMDTDIPGQYSHPVSFKQWMERNVTISRILSIGRDANFDSSARILTNTIMQSDGRPKATMIPTVNMRHLVSEKVISIDDVKHLFGGC